MRGPSGGEILDLHVVAMHGGSSALRLGAVLGRIGEGLRRGGGRAGVALGDREISGMIGGGSRRIELRDGESWGRAKVRVGVNFCMAPLPPRNFGSTLSSRTILLVLVPFLSPQLFRHCILVVSLRCRCSSERGEGRGTGG